MKRVVAAFILLSCSPARPSHPAQSAAHHVAALAATQRCLDVTIGGFDGLDGKVVTITDPSRVPQNCVVHNGQCHLCLYGVTSGEGSLLVTLSGSTADPVVFLWKNVETRQ